MEGACEAKFHHYCLVFRSFPWRYPRQRFLMSICMISRPPLQYCVLCCFQLVSGEAIQDSIVHYQWAVRMFRTRPSAHDSAVTKTLLSGTKLGHRDHPVRAYASARQLEFQAVHSISRYSQTFPGSYMRVFACCSPHSSCDHPAIVTQADRFCAYQVLAIEPVTRTYARNTAASLPVILEPRTTSHRKSSLRPALPHPCLLEEHQFLTAQTFPHRPNACPLFLKIQSCTRSLGATVGCALSLLLSCSGNTQGRGEQSEDWTQLKISVDLILAIVVAHFICLPPPPRRCRCVTNRRSMQIQPKRRESESDLLRACLYLDVVEALLSRSNSPFHLLGRVADHGSSPTVVAGRASTQSKVFSLCERSMEKRYQIRKKARSGARRWLLWPPPSPICHTERACDGEPIHSAHRR